MLKQSVMFFGNALDVALFLRIDHDSDSDEPDWKYCGISCCIAGRWMGDIEQVSTRGLITRIVDDIAHTECGEVQHFLADDPRIEKNLFTIFYPATVNEAIAAFFEYREGRKGVTGYLGTSHVGSSQIGEEHRLHLECEGMDASPYLLFTATCGECMRIYALHQENHMASFVHETNKSNFFSIFEEAKAFLTEV